MPNQFIGAERFADVASLVIANRRTRTFECRVRLVKRDGQYTCVCIEDKEYIVRSEAELANLLSLIKGLHVEDRICDGNCDGQVEHTTMICPKVFLQYFHWRLEAGRVDWKNFVPNVFYLQELVDLRIRTEDLIKSIYDEQGRVPQDYQGQELPNYFLKEQFESAFLEQLFKQWPTQKDLSIQPFEVLTLQVAIVIKLQEVLKEKLKAIDSEFPWWNEQHTYMLLQGIQKEKKEKKELDPKILKTYYSLEFLKVRH